MTAATAGHEAPTPDAEAVAARVLAADPSVGEVRLVCIDGPSGSGKTTFASALVAALEPSVGVVPVVHGDDLYEGWAVVRDAPDPVRAFGLLGEHLEASLVLPWRDGRPGTHRRWRWQSSAWGVDRLVPPAPVVVLEGVGLAGAALRRHAALVVWLDAAPALRAERVAARDGAVVDEHMGGWRAREDAWHALDGTAAAADVRYTTG